MLELNKVYLMDCIEGMKLLDDNSIDSIVTDPPYELGFMGKKWDNTGISYNIAMWKECLRVLKPGGHLLSFGGTRTYHRMACAIEDAGFEIRDQIQWIYGQGFPKSMDISKAIDKKFGAEREIVSSYETHDIRNNGLMDKKGSVIVNVTKPSTQEAKEWDGYGTALKPANEPLVLAQKPFTVVPVDLEEKISPANEPICVARKPLSEKTIVDNILKWGTGGINIDESRIETDDVLSFGSRKLGDGKCTPTTEGVQNVGGRFPTNVILDEEAAMILDEQSGVLKSGDNNISTKEGFFIEHKLSPPGYVHVSYGDTGGASRFFYCAKTSPGEKGKKITHPTVKPIKLMEYLITLVTPENAIVLDPFMGSGTTAISAFDSKRNFIGFENNLEYYNMISPLFKPPVKE